MMTADEARDRDAGLTRGIVYGLALVALPWGVFLTLLAVWVTR